MRPLALTRARLLADRISGTEKPTPLRYIQNDLDVSYETFEIIFTINISLWYGLILFIEMSGGT